MESRSLQKKGSTVSAGRWDMFLESCGFTHIGWLPATNNQKKYQNFHLFCIHLRGGSEGVRWFSWAPSSWTCEAQRLDFGFSYMAEHLWLPCREIWVSLPKEVLLGKLATQSSSEVRHSRPLLLQPSVSSGQHREEAEGSFPWWAHQAKRNHCDSPTRKPSLTEALWKC